LCPDHAGRPHCGELNVALNSHQFNIVPGSVNGRTVQF
jgi:hypothetical protein